MRILLLSDLHIEQGDPDFELDLDAFDIAFICGDVSDNAKWTVRYIHKFVEKVIKNKPYKFIPGNHDHWGNILSNSRYFFNQLSGHTPRKVVEFMGERILSCTLWYRPEDNAIKKDWSDYWCITDWPALRMEHDKDIEFLQKELREGDIVMTHMLPCMEAVTPKWIGHECNKYYVVDVSNLIQERKPKLWCMGHSHEAMFKQYESTWLARNPLGYRGENRFFNLWIIDTAKLGQYDAVEVISLNKE